MTENQILEALRIELARRRVTQRELERRFGWGHSYLSSVLAGRTDLKVKTLLHVLGALEVSPSEFLRRIEEQIGEAPERKASGATADPPAQEERLVREEQLQSLFELLQQAGKVAESLRDKDETISSAEGRGIG